MHVGFTQIRLVEMAAPHVLKEEEVAEEEEQEHGCLTVPLFLSSPPTQSLSSA